MSGMDIASRRIFCYYVWENVDLNFYTGGSRDLLLFLERWVEVAGVGASLHGLWDLSSPTRY